MFTDLDDLAVANVLSYCQPTQLLNISVLSKFVKSVSRNQELWQPHLEIKKKKYRLGLPNRILNESTPIPSVRLSLKCLSKQVSVKSLKELASFFKISPREILSCSEKSEIAKLIYDYQLKLLNELKSPRLLGSNSLLSNSYEREFDDIFFGCFWSYLYDLKRKWLFDHELIDRDWGMYWKPQEEGQSPRFHTVVKFHADGSFSSEDAQMASMNENKIWQRTREGISIEPYPVLEISRTRSGGWRLANPHVIMLSDVNYANGYTDHYT